VIPDWSASVSLAMSAKREKPHVASATLATGTVALQSRTNHGRDARATRYVCAVDNFLLTSYIS
jgi:hypothetical protein